MATINPYNPKASAKINTRIIPTNIFGSTAFALTPVSPTTPMAKPAAYWIKIINEIIINKLTNDEKPQQHPAAKCLYPLSAEYVSIYSTNLNYDKYWGGYLLF